MKLHHVYRNESVTGGGWQVRYHVMNRDFSKWFGDNKYKGSAAVSLAHAIVYRDTIAMPLINGFKKFKIKKPTK